MKKGAPRLRSSATKKLKISTSIQEDMGGTEMPWLMHSTPKRLVQVQALAWGSVLSLHSQSAALHRGGSRIFLEGGCTTKKWRN